MELLKTELVPGEPPVLQVAGEIDICSADELRTALDQAVAAHPKVQVDMAGVTFFDAAGLRVILRTAAARNGNGPLILMNAPKVAWVLDLVGLGSLPSVVIRDDGHARVC